MKSSNIIVYNKNIRRSDSFCITFSIALFELFTAKIFKKNTIAFSVFFLSFLSFSNNIFIASNTIVSGKENISITKQENTTIYVLENTLFYSKTKLNNTIIYSKKIEKIEKCNKTDFKNTFQKIKKADKLLSNNSKIPLSNHSKTIFVAAATTVVVHVNSENRTVSKIKFPTNCSAFLGNLVLKLNKTLKNIFYHILTEKSFSIVSSFTVRPPPTYFL